jgi:hypothetical protein
MPKIYRNIEQKRFNELDEADRNIWSKVVKNESRAVEQFDNPIKFQSKFERITAYTLQKQLEDIRNELGATIDDYNRGEVKEGGEMGKVIQMWNTLVSYLRNIILRGSISNKDIEKINSSLDSLKPLVAQVLTIAEEYRFSDVEQLRQLNNKFDGNDWTPITIVSKIQNINDIVPDIPEVLLNDADINPQDDDFDTVYRKLVDARAQLREIIDNIPDYGDIELNDLYAHYIRKVNRNLSKSKMKLALLNKLEPMLEQVNNTLSEMEARDEEEDDVFYDAMPAFAPDLPDEKENVPDDYEWGVPEPAFPDEDEDDFGFGGLYGLGKKKKQQKMKMKKIDKMKPALPFNDMLNDSYLFQQLK